MSQRELPAMPKFETESEEARWWFEHREALSRDLVSAAKSGRLGEGTLARAARLLFGKIRLPEHFLSCRMD